MQRKHTHYKARRAKAALRAVACDQGFLRRMKLPALRHIFHRGELQPLNRMRKANTTVDRLARGLARLAQHHRTCAAIALVAAFFRATEVQVFPNELQKRAGGWYILKA